MFQLVCACVERDRMTYSEIIGWHIKVNWSDIHRLAMTVKAFSNCQWVQWYAVLCKNMGVHLHVWVAWSTNQNKGAFHCAAPSFWDVMTWICVFFFAPGVWASLSCTSLWSVRVLMSVLWLWGSKVSTGNGCLFTAIYRPVCLWSGCLGSRRKQALQNPGWKFGNGGTGQNISPGCGCLWDSASLVHVHVNVCVHPAAYRHPAQPRWHLNSSGGGWKWQKMISLECSCGC